MASDPARRTSPASLLAQGVSRILVTTEDDVDRYRSYIGASEGGGGVGLATRLIGGAAEARWRLVPGVTLLIHDQYVRRGGATGRGSAAV